MNFSSRERFLAECNPNQIWWKQNLIMKSNSNNWIIFRKKVSSQNRVLIISRLFEHIGFEIILATAVFPKNSITKLNSRPIHKNVNPLWWEVIICVSLRNPNSYFYFHRWIYYQCSHLFTEGNSTVINKSKIPLINYWAKRVCVHASRSKQKHIT